MPYTFVAADALVLKVRENGRVVGAHTLIATGGNAEGYREILGLSAPPGTGGAAVQVLPAKSIVADRVAMKRELFWYPYTARRGKVQSLVTRLFAARDSAAPPRAAISRGSLC